MTINKIEFKSEGLDALRIYLLAQSAGVKQAELARRFVVNRSTIGRWLMSLEANNVPILWDEEKRVSIDRQRFFTHLSLSRHESIVLMLALRLYQQHQDKSDHNGGSGSMKARSPSPSRCASAASRSSAGNVASRAAQPEHNVCHGNPMAIASTSMM